MAQEVDLSDYQEMFRLDPEGFERLLEAPPHRAVSHHVCPNGETVVCVQNRKLHSGRDPHGEAKRFVRNISLDGKEVIVLQGYASGYVAHAFCQKDAARVVVYEPSLSILRESLPHLPPQSAIQIISTPEALITHFQEHQYLKDQVCLVAWPASARIQGPAFEQATEALSQAINQAHLTYNTQHIRSQGWLNNYLKNLPQFAKHPNLTNYHDAFSGYPAVICSAGPSLSDNAHLLKELQGKCLIIAVNTAAKALHALGVQAHVIVSVESLNITSQLRDIDWLPQCTAFLEVTGGQAAFELPFGAIVPICVESGRTSIFSERLCPGQRFSGGFCVSHAAVAIASILGCNGIVLIGQNLAFQDGRAYAKGTVFEDITVSTVNGRTAFQNYESKLKITQESDEVVKGKRTFDIGPGAITMPAWGSPDQTVNTSADYKVFARWFSEASPHLTNKGIWHVNATEGGIHIENWEEGTLADTIESHQLCAAPDSPQDSVEKRLEKLGQNPGLAPQIIIDELEREKAKIHEVLARVIEQRASVNNDPDGDLRITPELSAKIFSTWEDLRVQIKACPLLEAKIARSLLEMLKRQELNTYNLSVMIEAEINELLPALDPVLEELEAQVTQTRAAS